MNILAPKSSDRCFKMPFAGGAGLPLRGKRRSELSLARPPLDGGHRGRSRHLRPAKDILRHLSLPSTSNIEPGPVTDKEIWVWGSAAA
jgi:hypothetical protein